MKRDDLDALLGEIEGLLRERAQKHMVIVMLEPADDDMAKARKRAAEIERLGVHPESVELTVFVHTLRLS